MSEQAPGHEITDEVLQFGAASSPPKKRSLAKRLGCGLLLISWFLLLLTPCALFYLAANGEIRIHHADIPQPHEHPRLQISLISEADDRGLRIVTSFIVEPSDADRALCVETDVRFVLWESSAGDQDSRYCDCYGRASATAAWELTDTFGGACAAQG